MVNRSWIILILTIGCAGGGLTGTQVIPLRLATELKTLAVRNARDEIDRGSEGGALRYGVLLDTMVGPTPEAYLYTASHPRPWLGAMIDAHLVDAVFGVPGNDRGLPRLAFAIEVGEPYPLKADTVEIAYAWCVRRFPVIQGQAGRPAVWRDAFLPSDTGWVRVRHLRTIASTSCIP